MSNCDCKLDLLVFVCWFCIKNSIGKFNSKLTPFQNYFWNLEYINLTGHCYFRTECSLGWPTRSSKINWISELWYYGLKNLWRGKTVNFKGGSTARSKKGRDIRLRKIKNTIKPVYNDHPRDLVAVVDRRSLFRGTFML